MRISRGKNRWTEKWRKWTLEIQTEPIGHMLHRDLQSEYFQHEKKTKVHGPCVTYCYIYCPNGQYFHSYGKTMHAKLKFQLLKNQNVQVNSGFVLENARLHLLNLWLKFMVEIYGFFLLLCVCELLVLRDCFKSTYNI